MHVESQYAASVFINLKSNSQEGQLIGSLHVLGQDSKKGPSLTAICTVSRHNGEMPV